jgi:hypothetical protein
LAVPKTVYLEWDPNSIIGEIISSMRKREGQTGA